MPKKYALARASFDRKSSRFYGFFFQYAFVLSFGDFSYKNNPMLKTMLPILFSLMATSSVASGKHPSKVNCIDRDSQARFVVTAQPYNLYRISPVGSTDGYYATSDILQAKHPVLVTSVQSDQDGKELIEFVCKVSLRNTKYIEVLIARITDYGMAKVQCLACEQSNFF